MKGKLIFASTITLGILLSFVFFVFYLIAFWANIVDIEVLIILTVLTNFILWWVSPYLSTGYRRYFTKLGG